MALNIELPIQSLEAEEVKLDTVDEDQALRDLESQIQILEETRNNIEASKTVQKAQVQELVDECNYIPDVDCPINSYTEEPSQTNLAVTVESIWNTTKNILVAIIEKTKEILRKIFDFIDNLVGKWLSKSKNYAKIKETLKPLLMTREEIIEEFKKQNADFEKVASAPSLKEALPSSPDEIAKSEYSDAFDKLVAIGNPIAQQWAANYNDLIHYLFSETALTDGLNTVTIATQHAFEVLHKKLETISALGKELSELKKSNEVRSATDKLNYISKPIDAAPFKAASRLFDVTNTEPPVNSMMDCAQYLSEIIQKLSDGHTLPSIVPEDLITYHFLTGKHKYYDVVFPAEYIRKQMEKDKTIVSGLIAHVGASDNGSDIVRAYQNAAKSLVQEFNAAQNILFVVAQVNRNIYYFMTLAINLFENQLNKALIYARARGDEALIKTTEEHLNKLKQQLKSF